MTCFCAAGSIANKPIAMPYLTQKQSSGMTVAEWELAGKSLTFGHGENVTVQIEDRVMSRQHFRISPEAGGYLLQDLGSMNGTFVNGQRVTQALLKSNDRIKAGSSHFVFVDGPQTVVFRLKQEDHLAAVEKTTDQLSLAKLAIESDDRRVRSAAAQKITDPKVLADYGMWIRPELTQAVTSLDLLVELATKAKDWAVRSVAVAKLGDQALLAQIATGDTDPLVRSAALEKISDQAVLGQAALVDKEWQVRQVAIELLTDQRLLAEVARQPKHPETQYAAVQKLTDPALLANLAKDDPRDAIRQAAAARLAQL